MRLRRSVMVLSALLALLLWLPPLGAQGPGGSISGRVVEASTQRPLAGAAVTVTGTGRATTTGPDGGFTLTGVPAGVQRVRASMIGHTAQEQTVTVVAGQTAAASFSLPAEAVQLEGLVAVGYGSLQRRDVTGSVASVRPEEVQKLAPVSVQQALQGTVAGVQVTQGDAAPGGGIRIQIRGTNSFNKGSATPLYVIDGVPVSDGGVGKNELGSRREGELNSLTETNPLSTLSPSDIESIDILKDASATAIYGSRGANGVVLITTKKGRRGTAGQFNMSMSQGYASVVRRIPVLNAYDFATYVNQAQINAFGPDTEYPYGGREGSRTPEEIRALVGEGTDWQDLIFRTAPVTEGQIGFSGGDDNGSYAIMGNLLQQDGVIRGSEFTRAGLRVNLDRDVSSAVRISSNIALTRSVNDMVRSATMAGWRNLGVVRQALSYVPWQMPDTTSQDPRREDPAVFDAYGPNPLRYTDEVNEDDQVTRGLGGIKAVAQLGGGLALDLSLGSNYERRTYATYFPRTVWEGRQANGHAIQGGSEFTNLVSENLLRYNREMGTAHRLDVVTGFTYETNRSTWNNVEVQTFPSDLLGANVLQNGTNVFPPQSSVNEWTLASYLGRANYSLMDRYVFTATFRADGSSKFAENNKWAMFPAFAFAWRATEEPFLRDQDIFSDLKLRASYGRSGNQAIGTYASQARLEATTMIMNGAPVTAYRVTALANPDLRWETTDQYDVGMDFGVLDNRVTGSFDWYRKNTFDLLQQITLAGTTGYNTAWFNSGNVTNRGIEGQLNLAVLDGESLGGLTWDISANASRNRNRIESLGTTAEQQFAGRLGSGGGLEATPFIQKAGLPIGSIWGYRTDGLIRTAADSIAYAKLGQTARIGDVRYVDIDGDGKITGADRTVIGDANPDWQWGLTNRLSLGRFDLSALVVGVHGNDIINAEMMRYLDVNGQMNIPVAIAKNTFDPETNPNGKYPKVRWDRQGSATRFSDLYVEDGSYIRLKNVQLGYRISLPRAESARIYINAINLLTRTDYTGFDPEVSAFGRPDMGGVDMGSYPQSRQISIGVNATF